MGLGFRVSLISTITPTTEKEMEKNNKEMEIGFMKKLWGAANDD